VTVAYVDTQPSRLGSASSEKSQREDFAFQSPPTFVQSVLCPDVGRRWKLLVYVRRFGIEDLPEDEAGLRSWLEERWVEKGDLLEELRGRLLRGESWEDLEKEEEKKAE
jgi:hypothetical protein